MKKNTHLFVVLLTSIFLSNACKTSQQIAKTPQNAAIEQAMLKALTWQEANPIFAKAPTDWTNGAYYTCVVKAHQATKNQAYQEALLKISRSNKWETYIRPFHADDIVISNAYLHLKQLGVNEVNLAPTEKFINEHLYEPNDWKTGKGNKEQVILWWWCDALFMAPPVITKYAVMKNETKHIDAVHKYYMECYNLLYDKKEQLFYRDNRFCLLRKQKTTANASFGQGAMVGFWRDWLCCWKKCLKITNTVRFMKTFLKPCRNAF